ncbi:MAG: gliding motility-associated C-terminal domain-containing protein [Fulvivirga sp.]
MKQLLGNIALLSMVLLTTAAQGQYTSQKGWFTVDEVRGCAGLTINITLVPGMAPCICGDTGCPCDFDYDGDGNYDQNAMPLTYTFTEPGDYTLEILFIQPYGPDYINIQIEDNTAPEFNIHSCAGETVVIDISDNNFDNYVINYGDGTTQTVANTAAAPQHSYASNSLRTVEIRGLNNNAADNCITGTDDVIPIMSIPSPAITKLSILDNNTVELSYDLAPDIFYELQISPSNNGTYSFVKYIDPAIVQDTIRNLNLSDNYSCFRIAARDKCDNTVAAYSNIICSIDLNLAVENDVNKLIWKTADPDIDFSLQRDDMLTRPMAASIRTYDDVDVECSVNYCYTLVANYTSGYTSTSLPQCGTAFSTTPPEPVNNISTVVSGNTVNVAWEDAPNIDEYQIRKSSNGSAFAVSENNGYQDSDVATSMQSYCYQIRATDNCGNQTNEQSAACSILLTGTTAKGNTIALSWNAYTGWQNGVAQYLVKKSYPSGGTTQVSTITNSFTETDDNNNEQVIQYTIVAEPNDPGLQESISNTITVIKPVYIYYPDAFTPDGNGLNEEFKINGQFITTYQLRIYNRWGEMIYISDDMNEGWNGTTANGKQFPHGTYAFIAEMRDMAGREHTRTGTILLLRR